MVNCIDCKYYSSNLYLRCAVNPTALGGCEMGEVGEPLTPNKDHINVYPTDYLTASFRYPDYSPRTIVEILTAASLNNLGRLP
jgi:hypothetical protein